MPVGEVLAEALVLLTASVLVVLVSHRLRLPAVVGLLLTGVLIGPSGLALFSELEAVGVAAEIGVVFLLFAIGLELFPGRPVTGDRSTSSGLASGSSLWSPLDRLREIRRPFLLGGSVQSGLTIALVALVAAVAFGEPPKRAIFYGFLAALSSTAVVLTLYTARRELDAPQGKLLLGISTRWSAPSAFSIRLRRGRGRARVPRAECRRRDRTGVRRQPRRSFSIFRSRSSSSRRRSRRYSSSAFSRAAKSWPRFKASRWRISSSAILASAFWRVSATCRRTSGESASSRGGSMPLPAIRSRASS
jgi:hypothetical protein